MGVRWQNIKSKYNEQREEKQCQEKRAGTRRTHHLAAFGINPIPIHRFPIQGYFGISCVVRRLWESFFSFKQYLACHFKGNLRPFFKVALLENAL